MSSNRIKVGIIGTNGLPANYGGFETLVNYLTINQNPRIDYYVYCSTSNCTVRHDRYNNANLIYIPLRANGLQSLFYDIWSIFLSIRKHDVLLILGAASAIIFPFIKLFSSKPLITNFGGLEWKRDKFSFLKRLYLKFVERLAVIYSDELIVDNEYFLDYVLQNYNRNATLIEYGGDHVLRPQVESSDLQKYSFLNDRYFISVSRAQSDNNLHLLLESFASTPSIHLVLVSNWDKFAYGRDLKKRFQMYDNITLIDAVYDQRELDLLRSNAYVYIHSHTYCGTAPSLVEAMSLELPIIAFQNDTNPKSTENSALFFTNVDQLIRLLKSLNDSDLIDIKLKMKEIADKRYTWKRIVGLYEGLYFKSLRINIS